MGIMNSSKIKVRNLEKSFKTFFYMEYKINSRDKIKRFKNLKDTSKKFPVFFLQILNKYNFPKKTRNSNIIKLILEITRNNLSK
jgi:hypothetical protein